MPHVVRRPHLGLTPEARAHALRNAFSFRIGSTSHLRKLAVEALRIRFQLLSVVERPHLGLTPEARNCARGLRSRVPTL